MPIGVAHRTVFACVSDCYTSSWYAVRVRLSAGWPEVEMAVMWAALPRSGPCARLGDHKMGGSDAPHLHLRSDAASGAMPLGLSATSHSASRRPPTNPQRDAKKARIKETRLGEKCRGDSHAEGGGACPRPTEKKYDPSPPSCSSGAGLPRPRHAQCTSRNSALTSHVARVVAMDPCPRCLV